MHKILPAAVVVLAAGDPLPGNIDINVLQLQLYRAGVGALVQLEFNVGVD